MLGAKKKRKKKAAKIDIFEGIGPNAALQLKDLIAQAAEIVSTTCSHGRSGQDMRLWEMAQLLRKARSSHELLTKVFNIGTKHGQNLLRREQVQTDTDPNAYRAFCQVCGLRWKEHNADGSCKGRKSVAAMLTQ